VLSVDTNVLVRFFTRDDPGQAPRAAAVILNDDVWIPKTVLLETEWVLRTSYAFPSERVAAVLRDLIAADNVRVEEPLVVAQALDLFSAGLDFADALHLASSAQADRFVTFDEKLVRRAKGRTTCPVTRI